MMCGFALTEATVLILQRVPYPLSARLLSLIPGSASATHPSTLSLSPLAVTGCALAIVGGLLRVKCHRALGRFFTWQIAVHDGSDALRRARIIDACYASAQAGSEVAVAG